MPTPPIPGQLHPDVAILKSVFRELQPGQQITYADVAKSVQSPPESVRFRDRCRTARRHLVEEGIVIVAIPGEGFLRERSADTSARVSGREMRSIRRRARASGKQLEAVDVSELAQDKRPEHYANRVILRAIEKTTGKVSRDKVLAATTAAGELSVQKVLGLLSGK